MTKTTKQPAATPDTAKLEHLKILARQRENAARNLLKRRRAKSGQ